MIVRRRPIHDPPAGTHAVARCVAEAAVVLREVGVLGADEMEFGFAGGHRRVFFRGLAETAAEAAAAALRQTGGRQQQQRDAGAQEHAPQEGSLMRQPL